MNEDQTPPSSPRALSPRAQKERELRSEANGAIFAPVSRFGLFEEARAKLIDEYVAEKLAEYDQEQQQQEQQQPPQP